MLHSHTIIKKWKRFINSDNSVSVTGFYNRLDGEWDLHIGEMLNFELGSNFFGIVSNYNYTPKDFNINVGLSANTYNRTHSSVGIPSFEIDSYTNKGTKNEVSSYAKAEWTLGNFTLFGDTQLRHVVFKYDGNVALDNQDWSFFNPKAGLTYNLNKSNKFYGSVGKSHREPTRSDMFGGEDDLITFNEVTPEEVLDYEIGYNLTKSNFVLNVITGKSFFLAYLSSFIQPSLLAQPSNS